MHRVVALVVAVLAGAGLAVGQTGAQANSTALPLQRVAIELPSLDVAQVVLHAAPAPSALKGPFVVQKLRLGAVEIPTFVPAVIVPASGTTAVRIELQLRAVPEQVLGLPLERLPVSWEGTNEDGRERLTIEGTVNPTDPGSVDVPIKTLYDKYTKIADVRMFTENATVLVRVLSSLYNPFSFDLTATMLDYKVRAGEKEIIAGQRRGFRLRSRRWSDVVIEQEVAPADAAAGGFAALLRPSSVRVEGRMAIRTPTGDRVLQLALGGT
jgi:hypothetical protein